MATIQKYRDKYRAMVRKQGHIQTVTCTRKRDTKHWARKNKLLSELKL